MDTESPDPLAPDPPPPTAVDGPTAPALEVETLLRRLGTHRWPIVVDVRREPAWAASPHRLPGALRCAPDALGALAALLPPGTEVVCCCVHGHEVSRGAAQALRGLGLRAAILAGGIEAWREAGAPLRRADATLAIPPLGGSHWVTRERPKVDRIACPWLVRRYVDPLARFSYLPANEVAAFAAATGAIAFDLPGAAISHHGERCSFDTLLDAAGLDDPALRSLATVVRGADTDRLELAPQSAGLLAVSLGLSRVHGDDDAAMLEAGMSLYDALHAWSRDARHEAHRWQPAAAS
jgi:rhodanese-related sulfurtransferase